MEHNLMDQLMDRGYIDNKVVSFYTDMKDQDSSIKFGSWDEEGIKNKGRLNMVRTISPDSWSVSLSLVQVINQPLELSEARTMVLIEPMVPYIYIPESDFMKF